MKKKNILFKVGDMIKLHSGEAAKVIKVEDDDTTIPETKNLRDAFNISAINYLVEIKGQKGIFRINQNDVIKSDKTDIDEIYNEQETDEFFDV